MIPMQVATPMRCPDGFSALLVTCVDIADGPDLDHNGDVEFLDGHLMTAVPQPDHAHDGDVILLLHEPIANRMRPTMRSWRRRACLTPQRRMRVFLPTSWLAPCHR